MFAYLEGRAATATPTNAGVDGAAGGGGGERASRPGHSGHAHSQVLPHRASLGGPAMGATPEDRQRAVAALLSRGESFSLNEEDATHAYELTPDGSDRSPSSSPHASIVMMAASAPEISFTKQAVAPVQPVSSRTILHARDNRRCVWFRC